LNSIPNGVTILNRGSTLSLVGEGVKVQVYGENENNAYISADIIQPPQLPIKFNQSLNIISCEKLNGSTIVQLKATGDNLRNVSVILSRKSGEIVGEFQLNSEGIVGIEIDKTGIYTASLSVNPSVKARIVIYYPNIRPQN
jgi:hypothetical protein